MEDDASWQLENPCTVVPARNTQTSRAKCQKDGDVSEMIKGSPTTTFFPPHLLLCYGIKQVTSSQPSMQYIIFPIFNSQSEAVHHPNEMCRLNIKHKYRQLLFYYPSFSYNKNAHSEIWILTLVTTKTCANHITAEELSFTVDSWINLMVQPNSRGTIPWFPNLIPQSTTPLVPICHSTFPVICCITAC